MTLTQMASPFSIVLSSEKEDEEENYSPDGCLNIRDMGPSCVLLENLPESAILGGQKPHSRVISAPMGQIFEIGFFLQRKKIVIL